MAKDLAPDAHSIIVAWNQIALEAVRLGDPVPTVITRALHIAHAAMYDAWAAYDADAVGAYSSQEATGSDADIARAVSYAAHRALTDVFADQKFLFDTYLADLGLPREPAEGDEAAALGIAAAEAVLAARAADGSNAARDFADTSGYEPVNDDDPATLTDEGFDPNAWTPLRVPNGAVRDENGIPIATDNPATYTVQKPITPHWGAVDPFALEDGDVLRPQAPPHLGDDSPYTDALGQVTTGDAAYRAQFGALVELSANLTPEQKVIAEYWADGPQSSTPPGHWNEIAHDLSLREGYGLAEDVKLYFALNTALFDAGIAVWDAKYAHDFVRPQTAIQALYHDQLIETWAGPNQGTADVLGQDWQPYQDVTFVTPAFPEYTSGHSSFSYAAATILSEFVGSDVLYDGTSTGAYDLDEDGAPDLIGQYVTSDLVFEDYDGDPITLQWDTLWDAAADAGASRLYGGIHIQDGDLFAREMGLAAGETAWAAVSRLFSMDGDNHYDLDVAQLGRLDLGKGANVIAGSLPNLDGINVGNFDRNDAIVIMGLALTPSQLGLRSGSALLDIDADGDGTDDATLRLEGNFEGKSFVVKNEGSETQITLSDPEDVGLSDADERLALGGSSSAVAAGGGDDSVGGGGGADSIDGGPGADLLRGGAAADLLIGGGGADTTAGGAGPDVHAFAASDGLNADGETVEVIEDFAASEDSVELAGFDGISARTDLTWVDKEGSRAIALPDDRFIVFAGLTDESTLSDSNFSFPASGQSLGIVGDGTIRLTDDADRYVTDSATGLTVLAQAGDDAVVTGAGSDSVEGDAGDDVLRTGDSQDTLVGGAGNDVLTGGFKADTFVIRATDDPGEDGIVADTITDYTKGLDTVLIQGFAGIQAFADLTFFPVETGLAVELSPGRFLIFEGVTDVADLEAGDFAFGDTQAPVATLGLATDTGASDSDGITSNPAVSGNVSDTSGIASLTLQFGEAGPVLTITDLLQPDGSYRVDRALLEERLGTPVADGTYTVTLVATDPLGQATSVVLDFTLDATAPQVTVSDPLALTGTPTSVVIRFDGPVDAAAFAPGNYTLSQDGGSPPEITSVDQLDETSARLNLADGLLDGAYTLTIGRLADPAGNMQDLPTTISLEVSGVTKVAAIAPTSGTAKANLDRKITVEFDRAVTEDAVADGAIKVMASGEALDGRMTLSSNGKLVTFFPDELLPAATQVRVMVDGDKIMGEDGKAVDADGDGTPGGILESDFTTSALTRIPNTNIEGFIFDANYTDEDGLDIPLEGVVVKVIGLPDVTTVTDANGRFFLEDLPIPQVYLDFDASGVVNRPEFDYGTIVKPVDTVAGQTVGLGSGDKAFNIFFAALAERDVTEISPGEVTEAGIGENGLANLTEIFPGIDPAQWDKLKVTIPADSLTKDDGTPATEVSVMAFEPDRIPAPLPQGFDPTIVFTVKAGDATNVDGNAQITFPNIDNLDLGEKRPILSFDHDAGEWVQTGTAIVVDDGEGGTVLQSEGDTGVNTLGWKGVGDSSTGRGGYRPPDKKPPEDCTLWDKVKKVASNVWDYLDAAVEGAKVVAKQFPIVKLIKAGDAVVSGGKIALEISNIVDQLEGYSQQVADITSGATSFSVSEAQSFSSKVLSIISSAQSLKTLAQEEVKRANSKVLELNPAKNAYDAAKKTLQAALNTCKLQNEDPCFADSTSNAGACFELELQLQKINQAEALLNKLTPDIPGLETLAQKACDEAETIIAIATDLNDLLSLITSGASGSEIALKADALSVRVATFLIPNQARKVAKNTDDGLSDEDLVALIADAAIVLDQLSVEAEAARAELETEYDRIEAEVAAEGDVDGEANARIPLIEFYSREAISEIIPFSFDVFYMLDIDGLVSRGQTTLEQGFELNVPSGQEYTLRIYIPEAGLVATQTATSPSDGTNFTFAGLYFVNESDNDADGDGIADEAEPIVGTLVDDADTDGDGIKDGAEIAQGLNPLDDVGFPTGLIGNVPLAGEARDVTLVGARDGSGGQTAFVATGTHGLAIVDASDFQTPILQAQMKLDGITKQIAVDAGRGRAYVATESGGLHVVDVLDPALPVLVRTDAFPGGALAVEDLGGTLLVGGATSLFLVNAASGIVLNELPTDGPVNDIEVDGNVIYAVVGNSELVSYQLAGTNVTELDRIAFPESTILTQPEDKQVFVNDGVAYVSNGLEVRNVPIFRLEERGGYLTYDVSNPAELGLISNIDTPRVQAGNLETIVNGSGLALVAGGFVGLQVHDASDPENTYDLVAEFDTPGTANAVALASGIAYVADGAEGLQVINVLPFDAAGVAPTITFDLDAVDVDADTAGVQVQEGTRLQLALDIQDDVQVRNVELLLAGQVVENDVSAPFDITFDVPTLVTLGDTTGLEIAVRATDTGGNSTTTPAKTIEVVEDITPPEVLLITPADGRLILPERGLFTLTFSERVDSETFTSANARLIPDGGGPALAPSDVSVLPGNQVVQVSFETLPVGAYQIEFDLAGVADFAGNAIGGDPVTQSVEVAEATALWTDPNGGNWSQADRWSSEALPGPEDGVAMVLDEGSVLNIGTDAEADTIRLSGTVVLEGGSLHVNEINPDGGALELRSGRLTDAVIAPADGFSVTLGSSEAASFQQMRLENVTLGADATVLGRSTVQFRNGMTIDGTLTLEQSDQSVSAGIQVFGPQVIGGSGEIRLTRSGFYGGLTFFGTPGSIAVETATLGRDLTISGAGDVFANAPHYWQILGTVLADDGVLGFNSINQQGAPLSLGSTDDGVVEFTGRLRDADLRVAADANVQFNTAIVGATLSGPGVASFRGGSAEGLTLNGTAQVTGGIDTNANLQINGGLTINGTLSVDATQQENSGGISNLFFRGTQTVDGTGTLALTETNSTGAGTPLNRVNLSGGYGPDPQILTFGPDLTLVGQGAIEASGADRLQILGAVEGQDSGSGRALTLANVDQAGGTLTLDTTNGDIVLESSVNNSVLTGTGTAKFGAPTVLVNVDLAMAAEVDGFITVSDGLTVDDTLEVAAPESGFATLTFNGSQMVDGTGRLLLSDANANGGSFTNTLTLQGLNEGAETLTFGADLTLAGAGQLSSGGTEDKLKILGTLEGTAAGPLRIDDLDNDGAAVTVDASNGRVTFNGAITDVDVVAAAGQTGALDLAGEVELNALTLSLLTRIGEAASSETAYFTDGLTLNADLEIAAGAGLTALARFSGAQTVDGSGVIRLTNSNSPTEDPDGNSLFFQGLLTSSEVLTLADTITVIGQGSLTSNGSGDVIDVQGRVIADDGTLRVSDVGALGGVLEARDDGVLELQEDVTLSDRGTLAVALSAAGTGRIESTVARALAGTFALQVADDFTASLGDEFTVLTSTNGFSGSFDAFTGFDLGGGLAFALVDLDANTKVLRVVTTADATAGGFIPDGTVTPVDPPVGALTDVTLDQLASGVIEAVRVTGPGAQAEPLTLAGSTLSNVTLATDTTFRADVAQQSLTVQQGLTLDMAALRFEAAPDAAFDLVFDGAQTISGGTITFAASSDMPPLADQHLLSTPAGFFNFGNRITFDQDVTLDGHFRTTASSNLSFEILGQVTGTAGSTVTLEGIDNDGEALTVDATAGRVQLGNEIANTEFAGVGQVQILDGARLEEVTLALDAMLEADESGVTARVFNGLALDAATLALAANQNSATLNVFGLQGISGTGTVVMTPWADAMTANGLSGNAVRFQGYTSATDQIVVGAGIEFRGSGTIRTERTDDTLQILGTLRAEDGQMQVSNLDNQGETVFVDGSEGLLIFSDILRDTRFAAADDTPGEIYFARGTDLRDATLAVDATGFNDRQSEYDLTVRDGLILEDATLTLAGNTVFQSSLTVAGAQTIGGTGTILLAKADQQLGADPRNRLAFQGDSGQAEEIFVLGADVTVRGAGDVTVSSGDLLNLQGNLFAEGGTLSLAGGGATSGDLTVVMGATLRVNGALALEADTVTTIALGGAGQAACAGDIFATGNLRLGGAFAFDIAPDFEAALGTEFEILRAIEGLSGRFTAVTGAAIDAQRGLALVFDGDRLFARVVASAEQGQQFARSEQPLPILPLIEGNQTGVTLDAATAGGDLVEIASGANWSGVTLDVDAVAQKRPDESFSLSVSDGLTLNGLISLDGVPTSDSFFTRSIVTFRGAQTVDGTGEIALDNIDTDGTAILQTDIAQTENKTVVLGQDITLSGNGSVVTGSQTDRWQILGDVMARKDQLTLNRINQSGETLSLDSEAGGWVVLSSEIENAVIAPKLGADVVVDGATLTDVTLAGAGVTRLANATAGTALTVTGDARVETFKGNTSTTFTLNAGATVDGTLTIQHDGIGSGRVAIVAQGAQTFDGSGQILLTNLREDGFFGTSPGEAQILFRGSSAEADLLTIGADLTVQGVGRISTNSNSDRVRLLGDVIGDADGRDMALVLENIDQDGAALTLDTNNGAIELATRVERANIAGTGTVDLISGLVMSDVTLSMDARLGDPSSAVPRLTLENGLTLNGTLTLQTFSDFGGPRLSLSGGQTLDGTGRIEMTTPDSYSVTSNTQIVGQSGTSEAETFVIGQDVTIAGAGTVSVNRAEDRFQILGTLEGTDDGPLIARDIDNQGEALRIDARLGPVVLAGPVSNTVVQAVSGQTGSVTLQEGLTATNVTFNIDAQLGRPVFSQLVFAAGGLTVNETLTLQSIDGSGTGLAFLGAQTLNGTGAVVLQAIGGLSGASLTFDGDLDTAETLTIGQNMTLRGSGALAVRESEDNVVLLGRIEAVDGTMTLEQIAPMAGTLAAADTGLLDVNDDFSFAETGQLDLAISNAGTGRMDVQGVLTRDGTLDLAIAADLAANVGDEFTLLTASGGFAGAFDSVSGLTSGALVFETFETADAFGIRLIDDGL